MSARLAATNIGDPAARCQSTQVWRERKQMAGDTFATVEAYVVPQSGVGWIDCEWGREHLLASTRSGQLVPERRRVLADWTGRDHPSVVRDVIKIADEWFIYCHAVAEREAAAAALAADAEKTPGPLWPQMGPTGATGPSPPMTQSQRMLTEVQRQMEEMRRNGGVLAGTSLAGLDVTGAESVAGLLYGQLPPPAGDEGPDPFLPVDVQSEE